MIYKIFPILVFSFLFITTNKSYIKKTDLIANNNAVVTTEARVVNVYNALKLNNASLPNFDCFTNAFKGFNVLKQSNKIQKNILTIVDFSLSSTQKRLWVIDMNLQEVLVHSLVSHGKNSGEEFAAKFSNALQSFQSSLGFYATGETYFGKHGFSLRLDGLEPKINDKARVRAVVIHGADYVSEKFIDQNGRLGRSQGCPAVPIEISNELINLIKDKSCLFIYHPSVNYNKQTKLIS